MRSTSNVKWWRGGGTLRMTRLRQPTILAAEREKRTILAEWWEVWWVTSPRDGAEGEGNNAAG